MRGKRLKIASIIKIYLFFTRRVLRCVHMDFRDSTATMHPGRRRILCVEDDRDTASLISEELIDRGFEVQTAYNGRDGLAPP